MEYEYLAALSVVALVAWSLLAYMARTHVGDEFTIPAPPQPWRPSQKFEPLPAPYRIQRRP